MQKSSIKDSQHNWEKTNLISIKSSKGCYDTVKCTKCGMRGKRYNLSTVEVLNKYKYEHVNMCPTKGTNTIQIIYCSANNNEFQNAIPGSIHAIIPAPNDEFDDDYGVWIMGITEPIKILNREYTRE
jgi:hypothetical protein